MRRLLALFGLTAVVALGVVAASAAQPKADAVYTGTTSQDLRVKARTSADADAITGFTIRRRLDCGENDVTGSFSQTSGRVVIEADGRFENSAKVRPLGNSRIKRGRFTLSGRFGPAGLGARGTYRERVVLQGGLRCDTGTIRFRVRTSG